MVLLINKVSKNVHTRPFKYAQLFSFSRFLPILLLMVSLNIFKENYNHPLNQGVCVIGEFSIYDKEKMVFDHYFTFGCSSQNQNLTLP